LRDRTFSRLPHRQSVWIHAVVKPGGGGPRPRHSSPPALRPIQKESPQLSPSSPYDCTLHECIQLYGTKHMYVAALWNRIGVSALRAYEQALSCYDGASLLQADALSNSGTVYWTLGDMKVANKTATGSSSIRSTRRKVVSRQRAASAGTGLCTPRIKRRVEKQASFEPGL
jgi:hypothetical protein